MDKNLVAKYKYRTIILIVAVAVLVLWVIASIVDMTNKPQVQVVKVPTNIMEYIKPENLVRSHREYSRIETIAQKFIASNIDRQYADTYSVLSDDLKKKTSFGSYKKKIEAYTLENCEKGIETEFYDNVSNVKKIYFVAKKDKNEIYIAKIKKANAKQDEYFYLGIMTNTFTNKFRIVHIEL
ncbi:MAG: hypothetical protein RR922_04810 [Clostridia bacterium]